MTLRAYPRKPTHFYDVIPAYAGIHFDLARRNPEAA